MSKKPFIIVGIVITALALVFVLATVLAPIAGYQIRNGKIYLRTDSYTYVEPGMITCMAMMPECGVCYGNGGYGIVEDKTCYLPI